MTNNQSITTDNTGQFINNGIFIKNGGGKTDADNAWGATTANLWATTNTDLTTRYDLYSANYLNYSDNTSGTLKTRSECLPKRSGSRSCLTGNRRTATPFTRSTPSGSSFRHVT